jgi:hypothetical protein
MATQHPVHEFDFRHLITRFAPDSVSSDTTRGRWYWVRTIAFSASTILLTVEMVAGSLWALLQIEFNEAQLQHLGYPLYVDLILGPLKLAAAAALIAPRFPRLKEWAYAGMFFNFYGAVASHLFVGDGPDRWAYPLFLCVVTLVSWALRPADRRLPDAKPSSPTRLVDWAIPAAIILILLVLAYLTLPTGRGGY